MSAGERTGRRQGEDLEAVDPSPRSGDGRADTRAISRYGVRCRARLRLSKCGFPPSRE